MSYRNSNSDKILLGALIGGLAIGSSALFLSSKKGKQLRETSAEKLHEFRDRLEELIETATDRTQNLAGDISDKTEEYSNMVQNFAIEVRDFLSEIGTDENKEKLQSLLIGGLIGSLIGAGIASFATEGRGKKDIFSSLSTNANTLRNTLRELLLTLDERKNPRQRSSARLNGPSNQTSVTRDALDFVVSGIQLWQDIQGRRR